jgi:hypothetical protein
MAIVTGHDFKIYIGTTPIAGAQTCSLKFDNDVLETATKSTGRGKTFDYGRYSWTVDSDGLFLGDVVTESGVTVTSNKVLIQAGINATVLSFEFKAGTGETGYTKYSGSLLVKSGDISSPDYKKMTFKASFQGTGELGSTAITA